MRLDKKANIYIEFMRPIYFDLIRLHEKYINNSSELITKLHEYNDYRNGSITNPYSRQEFELFDKYGPAYITIKPKSSSMTFNNALLNGERILYNCGWCSTLTDFCESNGLIISSDAHRIYLHTDDSIVRDYKLNKLLDE